MRSHRRTFVTAALAGAALLAAGCGSGRDTSAFLPDDPPAVQSAAPAQREIPQVVVAGPKQALIDERDAAAADAKNSRAAALAAEERRRSARRELRDEREKSRRQRRRAAAREEKLAGALVAVRRRIRDTDLATPTPTPRVNEPDPPITASDDGSDLIAERDRRSDAEVRAAVLRFHELLDRRDVRSCELLTERLLVAIHGAEDPLGRCRAAVSSISEPVAVTIAESRTRGRVSSVAVITRIGEQEFAQTMRLVLIDGTWLFDDVERRGTD